VVVEARSCWITLLIEIRIHRHLLFDSLEHPSRIGEVPSSNPGLVILRTEHDHPNAPSGENEPWDVDAKHLVTCGESCSLNRCRVPQAPHFVLYG